jgi:catechol 2,3-dioxygenase
MEALPRLHFSHMGINVTDLGVMEDFYRRVLGFVVSDRGELGGGQQIVFLTRDPAVHHQVVMVTGRPREQHYNTIGQISLQLDTLEDLQSCQRMLQQDGRKLRPVDHGNAWSIYFKDPEGNMIELFADSPFYTPQPCGEPLDLSLPAAEIVRRTEAMCRARPGCALRAQWSASLAERIAKGGVRRQLAPVPTQPKNAPPVSITDRKKRRFTEKQGRYLAFIAYYTKIHRRPPAQADMLQYFRVTPPSVHQMVLTLAAKGFIARTPGQARSIRVLVPPEDLPPLE